MKSFTNRELDSVPPCYGCGATASPSRTLYFSREAKPATSLCETCLWSALMALAPAKEKSR